MVGPHNREAASGLGRMMHRGDIIETYLTVVVGDKLCGPDERLFPDFIAHGWTPSLA